MKVARRELHHISAKHIPFTYIVGLKMKPGSSTIEILAFKALERDIDGSTIAWASDMLSAGNDTEHLRILAGEHEPFNQFYLHALMDKVLSELNLSYVDADRTIKDYANYLIGLVLSKKLDAFEATTLLKDLYIEMDFESYLHGFYLLFFAKYDLMHWGDQHYWDGATKENIDQVMLDYFVEWRSNNS